MKFNINLIFQNLNSIKKFKIIKIYILANTQNLYDKTIII